MALPRSKIRQERQDEILEQFKNAHMKKAEHVEERQRMTVKGEVEWAENSGAICDGRVRKLLQKLKTGQLKPKAFKEAIKILKDPTRRRKDEYKNLFDHLINGDFLNFGENFPTILEAFESKDKDVQELAKKFTKKKGEDIQGEPDFLKELSRLKKSKLTPEELVRQSKAAVALAGSEEGESPVQSTVEKMLHAPDFGIVPQPNVDRSEFAEITRQMTEFLAESTQKLDELSAAVRESKTFAEAKTSLKEKLEKDPQYIKELTQKLLLDRTLLERSARILKRVHKDPGLLEALKEFDNKRHAYWLDNKIKTPEQGETPHTQFMKIEASKTAREALEKAALESKDKLFETALELEFERAIDEAAIEAAENGAKPEDTQLKVALEKTTKKYSLETKVVDLETLKKLKSKAEEFVSHQTQNAETKSRFIEQCQDIQSWEDEALDIADETEVFAEITGLDLFEQKDGKIVPRDTFIAYTQDGEKKTAKITKVEYKPLIVPEETERNYEANEHWRARLPNKGEMHITFEVDGRELTKDVKNFMGWASRVDAYEKISKEELEKRIGTKIEKGAMFLDEIVSQTERDKPHYNVIEIADITETGVKLQRPTMYRSRFEVYPQTITKKDENKDQLTFGEFYSLYLRREMMPLDDSVVEKAKLTKEKKWFRLEYGGGGFAGKGGKEERQMNTDGTLGDTLKTFGGGIFGKEILTPTQKEAFSRHPTFTERFFDHGSGKHFVRDHAPAARLMKYAGKNALAAVEEPVADEPPNPELSEEEQQEIAERAHEDGEKAQVERKAKGDRHLHQEALTTEKTHMYGDAHTTQRGYLSELWKNSKFLATDDIWGLIKSAYEHYERRWHRRSKEKFATVGEGLPWGYGTEMGRIKQAAENEEVQQYTEAMEEWGVWDVVEELRHAKNRDQLKACFKTLAHHGHIRWDDVYMWESVNKFVPQSLQIPIPAHHNPYMIDKKTGKTGLDYIENALDYLWGEGAYQGFFSENNSNYDSKLKKYEEKGKQTEGDVKNNGSVVGELANLLTRHKKGEYVDPHEYEGLIHFMINAGKGTMEAKVYFMIEGVTIKSPVTGESILGMDRLGSINGVYLNRLPFMDYLTRRDVPRPDGEATAWTIADFQKWCNKWDASADPKERPGMPPPGVTKFIWEHVLPDERTQIRNNKGLRNPEAIDHDDAHFIVPLADETLITNVCQSISGGKRGFTTEGYANAYPGYNQWTKSLAERGEKAKLINAVKAFNRYDAIMDSRYKKENLEGFARLDESFFHRPSVVDTRPTGWHKTQMEELTKAIANAYAEKYGETDLLQTVKDMYTTTGSMADKKEAEKQKKVQAALDMFGEKFKTTVEKDKAELLLQVVNSFDLSGMETITEEEKLKRAQMFKQSDLDKVFTDWHSDS